MKGEAPDVVVYGGTFDPLQEGHVTVLSRLRELYPHIVIAPTAQNPWKARDATSLAHRVAMIRLILEAENLPMTDDPTYPGIYIEENFEYSRVWQFIKNWRETRGTPIAWAVVEDDVETWEKWDEYKVPIERLTITVDVHSTQIRNGEVPPHPAIVDYIAEHGLYKGG